MFAASLARGGRYLRYWLKAVDAHSLHAPFVFRLYSEVIGSRPVNHRLTPIRELYATLRKDRTPLPITDYGTGNTSAGNPTRRISQLATSSHHPKVARLLFNLAKTYQPRTVFELGTNLGLTTLHLAAALPESHICTFEGCPNLSRKAEEHLKQLGYPHVKIITGALEHTLERELSHISQLDLAFIDANHRYQPTMAYFRQLLHSLHSKSILVVDDIHWSRGMEKAWEEIISHPRVTLSIDLFLTGLVFFNPQISKSHYILQY